MLACHPDHVGEILRRVNLAGYSGTVCNEGPVSKVHIVNVKLAGFVSQFKCGAANKTLPGWIFELTKEKASALLEGYLFGDGSHCTRGAYPGEKLGDYRVASSVSPKLALSLSLLVQRAFGIVASSYFSKVKKQTVIQGRTVNQCDRWNFSIPLHNRSNVLLGDYGTRLIRKNEATQDIGTVYNISVEEDESYVVNGIIVHNCRSHSMSGRRQGLGDEQGQVFDGVARVVRDVSPEIFVFENVKGLISSPDADGVKGGALRYMLNVMEGFGYTVEYKVLNANDHGTPQSRERIFIVGSKSGQHWAPPQPTLPGLTVYDGLADLLEVEGDIDLPNHVPTKHSQEIIDRIAQLGPGEGLYSGDVSPGRKKYSEGRQRLCLDLPSPTVKPNNGGLDIHPFENRGLTPREMARLQGFPDDFVFHGSISSWVLQIGNAVPPPLAKAVAESVRGLVQC